jgi:Tfp pilus assembly protein PilO
MALKKREKIFIGLTVLIGLVMGFDQLVTQPKKKEVTALRQQVKDLDEKLAAVTGTLAGLKPIRVRVEEKRKRRDLYKGKVPDITQLSLLLEQLGRESGSKNMDIIQLTIKDEVEVVPFSQEKGKPSKTPLRKMLLDMGLQVHFEQLGSYLETIQDLPIFLELEKVDIRRKEQSFPKLQVQLMPSLTLTRTTGKGDKEGGGKTVELRPKPHP